MDLKCRSFFAISYPMWPIIKIFRQSPMMFACVVRDFLSIEDECRQWTYSCQCFTRWLLHLLSTIMWKRRTGWRDWWKRMWNRFLFRSIGRKKNSLFLSNGCEYWSTNSYSGLFRRFNEIHRVKDRWMMYWIVYLSL